MRTLIALAAMAGLGLCSAVLADDAQAPPASPAAVASFTFGSFRITTLRDASFAAPNDAKVFGVDVGTAAVGELLKANGLADDHIDLSVDALLVRSGHRVMLFDTGLGPKAHGLLQESLKLSGVRPDEITDVFITHSHFDHVGGLVDADGHAAFAKATVHMAAAEWEWMKSQTNNAALVKAIEAQIKTFAPGVVLANGVRSIALNGHTPGHVGYEIGSAKTKILDIGDLAHSSIVSLQKPEWTMGYDKDAALSKSTRRQTLERLARDHEFVYAPHFPFPGIGHVVVSAGAFSWHPETP